MSQKNFEESKKLAAEIRLTGNQIFIDLLDKLNLKEFIVSEKGKLSNWVQNVSLTREDLENVWNQTTIIYKGIFNKLSKDVLRETGLSLGLIVDDENLEKKLKSRIKPKQKKQKYSLPFTKNELKDIIIDFFKQKLDLIQYILENFEVDCWKVSQAIHSTLKRFNIEKYKNSTDPKEKEIYRELQKRISNLDSTTRTFHNKLLTQMKKLSQDIDRKDLDNIQNEVYKIMTENYGQCCLAIDPLRNFAWAYLDPSTWRLAYDPKEKRNYWYNTITNATTWEDPSKLQDSNLWVNLALYNNGTPLQCQSAPKDLEEAGGLLKTRKRGETICEVPEKTIDILTQKFKRKFKEAKLPIKRTHFKPYNCPLKR